MIENINSSTQTTIKSLSKSIMMFLIEAIHRGDHRLLKDMGLADEHISLLGQMSVTELLEITNHRGSVFNLSIDRNRFDILLKSMERDRVINECVRAGAPNDFLSQFFGWNSRDCSARRAMLGVDAKMTKRVASDESEIRAVHACYIQIIEELGHEDFEADHYLALYDRVKSQHKEVPLKAIWWCVNRFQEELISKESENEEFGKKGVAQ